MKTFSLASLFALVAFVSAQTTHEAGTGTLPPSPIASIGCVPHGDHWDCEAPAPATGAAVTVTSASEGPGASPTESIGCVPHDDHWDCEGPAVTGAAASATVTSVHDDDHSYTGSEGPGPSPIESVGCVSHGDHWDCEAAATATRVIGASTAATAAAATGTENSSATSASAQAESSRPAQQTVSGAGQVQARFGGIAAMLIAVVLAF